MGFTGIRINIKSEIPMDHFNETEIELSQENEEQNGVIIIQVKDGIVEVKK